MKVRTKPEAAINAGMYAYLKSGQMDDVPKDDWFEVFRALHDDVAPRSAWLTVKDRLVADWIATRPGTRPWAWWAFEAPKVPVNVGARTPNGEIAAQRLRLGGIGTPCHEVLNYAPSFRFGLPVSWVSDWDEAYYNGRKRDIHGQQIGTKYHEGDFKGLAPRADDPPRFESQAAFLKRHNLLLPREDQGLTAADFEPELIDVSEDKEHDGDCTKPDSADGE